MSKRQYEFPLSVLVTIYYKFKMYLFVKSIVKNWTETFTISHN